jgi:predicted ATPase with chaperone activity
MHGPVLSRHVKRDAPSTSQIWRERSLSKTESEISDSAIVERQKTVRRGADIERAKAGFLALDAHLGSHWISQ